MWGEVFWEAQTSAGEGRWEVWHVAIREQHLALLNIGSQAAFKSLCFSLLHNAYTVTEDSSAGGVKYSLQRLPNHTRLQETLWGPYQTPLLHSVTSVYSKAEGCSLVHPRKVELRHRKIIARQQLLPSPELRAVVARQQQRPAGDNHDFSFTGPKDSH